MAIAVVVVLPQSSVGGQAITHLRVEFEPDFERRSCLVDKGQAELKNRRFLNPACKFHGTVGSGNIVRHGFYRTRSGKRRRYRCVRCGKTFSSTKGTPYYRFQHRRAGFERSSLSESRAPACPRSLGSRVSLGTPWRACLRRPPMRAVASTADESLDSPSKSSRQTRFAPSPEARADRSLVSSLAVDNRRATKLLEHFGARSRRLEANGLRETSLDRHRRIRFLREERHGVRRVFGQAALYGQVLKTRRNDRVVKVER